MMILFYSRSYHHRMLTLHSLRHDNDAELHDHRIVTRLKSQWSIFAKFKVAIKQYDAMPVAVLLWLHYYSVQLQESVSVCLTIE